MVKTGYIHIRVSPDDRLRIRANADLAGARQIAPFIRDLATNRAVDLFTRLNGTNELLERMYKVEQENNILLKRVVEKLG